MFDCTGVIMHQSYRGEVESKLSFWFGVDSEDNVGGEITEVGAPLSLPDQALSGKFEGNFDGKGRFTGGRMKVAWPYANLGRPVELALMRETFIRVGHKVNGVGKVLRRTSNHTYVAGRLYFDPVSYPTLKSLYRISFISATCFPGNGARNGELALTAGLMRGPACVALERAFIKPRHRGTVCGPASATARPSLCEASLAGG